MVRLGKIGWFYFSTAQKVGWVSTVALLGAMYVLQLVWYRLILIGLGKALGCIKKSKKVDDHKNE